MCYSERKFNGSFSILEMLRNECGVLPVRGRTTHGGTTMTTGTGATVSRRSASNGNWNLVYLVPVRFLDSLVLPDEETYVSSSGDFLYILLCGY